MKKLKTILFLPGDGIGKEVMTVAERVLAATAARFEITHATSHGKIGWDAYDKYGDTMPKETWSQIDRADAILLGAVGDPKRDVEVEPDMRPERRALLALRKKLELGCNIRPIRVLPDLAEFSPLKDEIIGEGIDLTFYRELLGGDYFGKKRESKSGRWAEDLCTYTREQIEQIARVAFTDALHRRCKLTSIDKANVLGATGTFWRRVVTEIHETEFPSVELEHIFVDAMNLYLFTRPSEYRILLCSNAHGDILSDGAAGLAGSMGLLPSASINTSTDVALYEPSGGSAPDIAGKDVANPVAMILSVALMLRQTFGHSEAAECVENAVSAVLAEYRTADIASLGITTVGTKRFGELVCENITDSVPTSA